MEKKKLMLSIITILFIYVFVGAASGQETQGAEEQALFSGAISGSCFNDLNEDGKKDAGEAGVEGITVSLKRLVFFLFPQEAGSATAGADGAYEIAGLRPGLYLVQAQNSSAVECRTKNPVLTWLGFFKNTQTADFGFTVTAPAPTVIFSAEPQAIDTGASSILSWSSQDAETVSIDQGIGDVALQGSVSVSPDKTTSYTITAQGKGGTAQASVTVTVTIPQPVTTTTTTDGPPVTTSTSIAGGGGGGGGGGETTTVRPSTTTSAQLATTTTTSAQSTTSVATSSSTSTIPVANTNVPDVIGKPQAEAETIITTAGFTAGTIIQQYSSIITTPGCVVSQYPYPLPGTLAAAGLAINLIVSLGPGSGELPPDPSDIAPPVDPGFATLPYEGSGFLYEGDPPIQTGVAPGTIIPRQVAVLRGRVLTRQGDVLPGVTITILNRPDFGQTLSRADDGRFDMVVNGGGLMIISYQKDGYLPAQRQLNIPWQDYVSIPDVVMIPLDSAATAVDLTETTQSHTAQGSSVTDSSGTRQINLYFPPGVQAWLVMPDGSEQPANTLTVRATEYTVGDNGPEAMPAELPPTSFYTYAVELSADEAQPPEFTGVRFSMDVYAYLDNFIEFPVGTKIPYGSYDLEKAVWVPYTDGRVIKIVSIAGGLAVLDTDGDGNPDNALGISTDELEKLADLYPAGKSLWRMPMNHFTPGDGNLSVTTDPGAQGPQLPGAEQGETPVLNPNSNNQYGNIYFQNRVFGEQAPVVGTPFSLYYSSDRVPGRKVTGTLKIQLSGPTIPAPLKRIELRVEVAGRVFTYSFAAETNQSYDFTWDRTDAYGRTMQGAQPATIRIGYVYDGYYALPTAAGASFGLASGIPIIGEDGFSKFPARQEVFLWQEQHANINFSDTKLGGWDARAMGLGGWTLNVHHAYDPASRILYLGNGSQRNNQSSIGTIIKTVAGNGGTGYDGDGGPAENATFNQLFDIAFAPDGSYYISDFNNNCIRKVDASGIISTVKDTLGVKFPESGNPYGVAVGLDGSLYTMVYRGSYNLIQRLSPAGIVSTVCGTDNTSASPDDGRPATETKIGGFWIAMGPDGCLYVAEPTRIRKIGADGIVWTVAGTGQQGYNGDNIPATQARLNIIEDIAFGPDGCLYVADSNNYRVRKVGADGIITTVAGIGTYYGSSGDGGPATSAQILPVSIARSPEGSLFILDSNRVRQVGIDGIIKTIAGGGSPLDSLGDNGPPASAKITYPATIAVAKDGSLFCGERGKNIIRRIGSVVPGFSGEDIAIASDDGSMLYQFDRNGRHLKTRNSLTGADIYSFGYENNLLVSITDGDGNVTSIARDGSGKPTAIIAPFGQPTTLSLTADGYLASITNPASEAMQLEYTGDGLLSSVTGARGSGFTYTFEYDSRGNLLTGSDPAGGSDTLSRTEITDGYQVTDVTGMGITSTYEVKNLATGEQQLQNTLPDSTMVTTLIKPDGTRTYNVPDGTQTNIVKGPDPRFFMQAPVTQCSTVSTPGGKILTAAMNRSVQLADPNNALSIVALTETYSINGRAAMLVFNAAGRTYTDTSPAGRQVVKTVDAMGRVTQSTVAGLAPVNYAYDDKGRLSGISTGSRNTAFTYNSTSGYPETIVNALGQITQFVYNIAGRRTQTTLPDGSVVTYAYDAHGNMTSLTPPGRPAHAFSFNGVDLRSDYTAPGDTITSYAYNKDRQLTQVTKPGGISVNSSYDAIKGRLNTITLPNGPIAFSYNPATGKVSAVTAPDGTAVSFTYDGALLTGETWAGAVTGSVTRAYDNDFRVSSFSINGESAVSFQYDNDSLLTQAGDITMNRSAQNGLLTGTTLAAVNDTFSYNQFGEPAGYNAAYNSTSLYSAQYTRDNLGRITEKTETTNGATHTYDYTYDLEGRLSEVKKDDAVTASYTYDSNGNRLTGPGGVTGTYDAQDRMLSYGTTTYLYTANGELQSKTAGAQTTAYQYDALGNLLSVTLSDATQIQYVVDGRNRRIGKKVNGSLNKGFLYGSQLNPVVELDGSNNPVSYFVYGSRNNVPDYMVKGGVTYRIISDHLGSPRLVVNTQNGDIVQRMEYDEFGRVTQDTSPEFQPFGFAGGLYDHETGLVRFGARDYDAETGRWTAKDLLLFQGGGYNLYEYVYNNPINFTDALGTGPPGSPGWDNPPPLTPQQQWNQQLFSQFMNNLGQQVCAFWNGESSFSSEPAHYQIQGGIDYGGQPGISVNGHIFIPAHPPITNPNGGQVNISVPAAIDNGVGPAVYINGQLWASPRP